MQKLVKHPKRTKRDARVDIIGLVKEIVAHYVGSGETGLVAKVKAGMKPGHVVEGDLFFGRLDACTATRVNTRKVLQLFLDGKIPLPAMVAMCSVKVEPARKHFSAADWKKLSSIEPGNPSLDVCRRPGFEPDLVAALKMLLEQAPPASVKPAAAAGR